MKILLLRCWNCDTEKTKPVVADIGGYFEVPRFFCPKCLNEVDWELVDEDTGATRAVSDDSGDR